MVRALAIVPARYASSRFPGKSLAPLKDKPVIQWVWEGICTSARIQKVLIATDDERIASAVRDFGGEAVMTSSEIRSGTDRVAHVAREHEFDIVVNVQADEPLVTGTSLDRLIEALDRDPALAAATLQEPIETVGDLFDPNIVKVAGSADGDALYFSRSPIPYFRAEGKLRSDFRAVLFRRDRPVEGFCRHVGAAAASRDRTADQADRYRFPLCGG
jgi:3-deoxy-manno-octulosonate cytidylyltransferase (CMP-KDO synthetase)